MGRHIGELVRSVLEAGETHLVTSVVYDRPIAAVCDWSDTPTSIEPESGVVLGELAGHRTSRVCSPTTGRHLMVLSDGEAVHLWKVEAGRPTGQLMVGPASWCASAAIFDG